MRSEEHSWRDEMIKTTLFLFVPLALASIAFSGTKPQQSSSPEWRQTQRTDDVRGAYTRFTLVGKFLKSPEGDTANRPALVVDCSSYNRSHRSKFWRGNMVVGDPLKIDWVEPEEIHGISYFPKVAVEYRLNDGKEEKENWTPGTEKTSASFSKGSFEKMLRAQTVEITAEDNHGSQVVMQFYMPDPTPVEQSCDVDFHGK
jgi:hypothetical protein